MNQQRLSVADDTRHSCAVALRIQAAAVFQALLALNREFGNNRRAASGNPAPSPGQDTRRGRDNDRQALPVAPAGNIPDPVAA